MTEIPYSNRELDAQFGAVHEKLDQIVVQTTATNGKVRKITIALVALGCFCVGLGLRELAPFTSLFLAL